MTQKIRRPAVAGQFYPAGERILREEISELMKHEVVVPSFPKMLLCPHAGYPFSGRIAGKGYAQIDPETSTVILIGPAHRKPIRGLSIPPVTHYETPLGRVPLDDNLVSRLRESSLVTEDIDAHATEHCLEVQLPFLQIKLRAFSIVPILTGLADPRQVADLVAPHMTPGVLVVISSDLSHFYSSEEAKELDGRSVVTIQELDTDGFIDGCGETGIRTGIYLARQFNLKPIVLETKNSFEAAPDYGSQHRVVGYTSVAFVET